MKKWMVIELVVLSVLLVAALTAGIILAAPVLFPDSNAPSTADTAQTAPVDTAETIQVSTTEAPQSTSQPTPESTAAATQESTGETVQDSTTEPTLSTPTNPKPTEPKPTVPAGTPTEPTQETAEPTVVTEPTEATEPAQRQLLARQYFVYDVNTDSFATISGKPDDRIYPASITKLFTIQVALQYLLPEEEITAGEELSMVSWDASIANIKRGDVLTVRQLIAGMLLPSGNDAAHVIACHTGRIIAQDPELEATAAVQVFVDSMNTHAAQLGMTGSHFVNPDGMHSENHYMTFADLVTLGKLSLENELIVQYAATRKEEITLHEQSIVWKNTNRLIDPNSSYYNPYAVGLKTGQTKAAGSCLLSAYQIEDQQLLIGVFGTPSEKDRFEDTLQLFNAWFLS